MIILQPGSRILEKAILSYIDGLVNIIIELSIKTAVEKKILFDQAVTLVKELSPLLLNLVGAREEHLETLIRQLVTQKLPQGQVLKSFGDLHKDLNYILALAFHTPQRTDGERGNESIGELPPVHNPDISMEEKEPEIEVETVAAMEVEAEVDTVDKLLHGENETELPVCAAKTAPQLEQILRQIFPGEGIQQDYYFRGLHFSYYLPQRRLGIRSGQICSWRNKNIYENLLKKESIQVVDIEPWEVEAPPLLIRKLSRF